MINTTALVKRARHCRGLTQKELAEFLGVDQAAVSKWERGKHEPSPKVLRQLRDIIRRCMPSITQQYVERLPMQTAVSQADDLRNILTISAATSAAYGKSPAEMRGTHVGHLLTDSINEFVEKLITHDAWKDRNVAWYEGVRRRPDDTWAKTVGSLLGTSDWVRWYNTPLPDRNASVHPFIRIVTFDELRS